ncbi:restriction endonuclease subunit S [Treponema zioleckii]|uniref:restriction endonuclease subunit S n=1 Tax=Treponema zioleckii TaxID=331680 RepID=UPI00168AC734|nr:restriction endonuclease subunit S [Treponema zioleckii]
MTAKDLKNALLQEAVQGKLVPQIASEGNAKDLLEKIKAEKAKLIKDGKIKKEKPLPAITEDEIPFDIPENWCWCRIGEIFNLQAGKTISSSEISEISNGNDYLCYGGNGIRGYVKKYNREGYYPLIGRQGALCGNVNFANGKFYATEHAVVVDTYANTNVDWAGLFLKALNLNQYATATAQPGLAVRNINEVAIPLPPLAEQKRIVTAIEKFMPLIEDYGKKETELTALNADIAKTLKNAILQEAVQGKLAPQIASEGNAKDLLEEIKKEKAKLIKDGKIKKEKPLPPIYDVDGRLLSEVEVPFDIPENWCWCRLGEIAYKLTDGTHRTPKYTSSGIPFLSVKDMSSGKLDFSHTKFITEEEHKELYKRCNPEKGDMLLTKVGTTGIPVINDSDVEFSLFVSVALIKFPHHFIDEKYFLYMLMSPLVQDQAKENTRGVGNKNWVMDAIANTMLALPPLAEQKRIVETVEKILPLFEKVGE